MEVNSPTTGPAKGSNLNVVLIDQTMAQDADGKPLNPLRGAALATPAKKAGTDTAGTMVVSGLFEPHGPDGNGTEQLISVTSIPSYSRQVFLPSP